jgi:hypothetical protein
MRHNNFGQNFFAPCNLLLRKLKILARTAKSYIFAEMQGKPLEIDMGQNKNHDLSQ